MSLVKANQKVNPCVILGYSNFSDAYKSLVYEGNFSALKVKNDTEVKCEIFTKIGNVNDTRGLMKTLKEKKKDYLFYPYVINKNTKINKDGCSGFEFILVPYAYPDSVVCVVETTFSVSMKIIPMKNNIDLNSIQQIKSISDLVDSSKLPPNSRIFFSGELNNKIMSREYSFLLINDKLNSIPEKKIGFTPLGNFSLNTKLIPCSKDYCNFFFLPINDDDKNIPKIAEIKPLNQGSYNYAGNVKLGTTAASVAVGMVAVPVIALSVLDTKPSSASSLSRHMLPNTGNTSNLLQSSKSDNKSINIKDPAKTSEFNMLETSVFVLPICFGYSTMPIIGNQSGGIYKNKYLKYRNKLLQ